MEHLEIPQPGPFLGMQNVSSVRFENDVNGLDRSGTE